MVAHNLKGHDSQSRHFRQTSRHQIHHVTIVVIVSEQQFRQVPRSVKMPPISMTKKGDCALLLSVRIRKSFHNLSSLLRASYSTVYARMVIYPLSRSLQCPRSRERPFHKPQVTHSPPYTKKRARCDITQLALRIPCSAAFSLPIASTSKSPA